MSEVREEVLTYIDELPDNSLEALKPLLRFLLNDSYVIETGLTDGEKEIVRRGREEYKKGGFVPLEKL